MIKTSLLSFIGILYLTNETNQCNEEFAKKEAKKKLQTVGLLKDIKFTKN